MHKGHGWQTMGPVCCVPSECWYDVLLLLLMNYRHSPVKQENPQIHRRLEFSTEINTRHIHVLMDFAEQLQLSVQHPMSQLTSSNQYELASASKCQRLELFFNLIVHQERLWTWMRKYHFFIPITWRQANITTKTDACRTQLLLSESKWAECWVRNPASTRNNIFYTLNNLVAPKT